MKKQILTLCAASLLVFNSCSGQDNPKYIGADFGVFDLDKISFNEKLDTLISRVPRFLRLPKSEEYYDDQLKKNVKGDTLYSIIRIPAKSIEKNSLSFKGLAVMKAVDFYVDQAGVFRKFEFSFYLDEQQYNRLLTAAKDFKDITPEMVRKFNNGKYHIIQKLETDVKTTLYCLQNPDDQSEEGKYFIRVSKISLKSKGDGFYRRFDDVIK